MALDLDLLLTAAGTVGAVLVLASFGLVSAGRALPGGVRSSTMNLFGGLLLLVSCVAQGAWPSAGVNVVWVAISVIALVRFFLPGPASADGEPEAAGYAVARDWVAEHTGEFRMPQTTGEFPAPTR